MAKATTFAEIGEQLVELQVKLHSLQHAYSDYTQGSARIVLEMFEVATAMRLSA